MVLSEVKHIVIHTADTPAGRKFTANDIDIWHKLRGFKMIGYHYVVLLDGTIEIGREIHEKGAHVKGFNNSIGVCYIGGGGGKDTRTNAQKLSLMYLVGYLKKLCPKAEVLGHRDFSNVSKTFPNFDAKKEYKNL